ncbi:expressed unknown protein [Seminavis robusta]|uniref:Fatty acid hydroxylase domain-containing protein n=1 Tax=Seminavis robusta TaxID=568900 RepID=A0A9N8D7V0_9STRA|nr:expressed unknown protein [Seminavis robusta]|eukprot:Sro10_g007960.1 n/a (292) ;mRNA; f:61888-62763
MVSLPSDLPYLATLSWSELYELYWEEVHETACRGFVDGVWLMVYIIIPTLLLEMWSFETAAALYKKNARLYKTAFALNFFNHFGLGAICYAFTITFFAKNVPHPVLASTDSTDSTMLLLASYYLTIAGQVLTLMIVHSLCFYTVHRIFHTYPKLYKWHKFHHLFNTHVPPITANAVSPVEYLIGYLIPFLISMTLFQHCELALWIAIQVVSIFNIAMHTPKLERYYDKILPSWMVGTGDHLEHHKRLNCHYAAPTLDLDYLVEVIGEEVHGLLHGTSVSDFKKKQDDEVSR